MFLLLQVLQESRHDDEMEEEPHGDHEQGRLDGRATRSLARADAAT